MKTQHIPHFVKTEVNSKSKHKNKHKIIIVS